MDSITTGNSVVNPRRIASSRAYDATSELNIERIINELSYEYCEREEDINMEPTSVLYRKEQLEQWREWYITDIQA